MKEISVDLSSPIEERDICTSIRLERIKATAALRVEMHITCHDMIRERFRPCGTWLMRSRIKSCRVGFKSLRLLVPFILSDTQKNHVISIGIKGSSFYDNKINYLY